MVAWRNICAFVSKQDWCLYPMLTSSSHLAVELCLTLELSLMATMTVLADTSPRANALEWALAPARPRLHVADFLHRMPNRRRREPRRRRCAGGRCRPAVAASRIRRTRDGARADAACQLHATTETIVGQCTMPSPKTIRNRPVYCGWRIRPYTPSVIRRP